MKKRLFRKANEFLDIEGPQALRDEDSVEELRFQLTPQASLHLIEMTADGRFILLVEVHDQNDFIEWAVGLPLDNLVELKEAVSALSDKDAILEQGQDIDSIIATVHEKLLPFSQARFAILYGLKNYGVRTMKKKFHKADSYNDFYSRIKKVAVVYEEDVQEGVDIMINEASSGVLAGDAFQKGVQAIATSAINDEMLAGRTAVEAMQYMKTVPIQNQILETLRRTSPDHVAYFQPYIQAMDWSTIVDTAGAMFV